MSSAEIALIRDPSTRRCGNKLPFDVTSGRTLTLSCTVYFLANQQTVFIAGLALLGPIEEKFVDVTDLYVPKEDGTKDKAFISRGAGYAFSFRRRRPGSCAWLLVQDKGACQTQSWPNQKVLVASEAHMVTINNQLLPSVQPVRDRCAGYDATSHFETTVEDVLDMYQRITGKPLDLSQTQDISQANTDV